jgi:hypothetical protein
MYYIRELYLSQKHKDINCSLRKLSYLRSLLLFILVALCTSITSANTPILFITIFISLLNYSRPFLSILYLVFKVIKDMPTSLRLTLLVCHFSTVNRIALCSLRYKLNLTYLKRLLRTIIRMFIYIIV